MIKLRITTAGGTKIELDIPIDESKPASIESAVPYQPAQDTPVEVPTESQGEVVRMFDKPAPVQPAQDLADYFSSHESIFSHENIFCGDAMSAEQATEALDKAMWKYKTSPTFPSNKDLELTGKRYTSVQDMVDELKQDPESGKTMSLYDITYVTQDGKEWKVPPGLMKDLIIIYGEKTVEQELWKAHAWLEADPKRRKTSRGMGRYLNGWLSRASSMVRTPIKTLLKRDNSLLATNGNTQEGW